MTKMLSYLIIMFSFTMLFFNHPLYLSLLILIQTILSCLLMGMMIKTYWFSYILLLIFSGGLLILFIYVASIASNEMINISSRVKFFILFIFLFIFTIHLMNDFLWTNNFFNSEMINFFWEFKNEKENKINLLKMYNSQTFMLTMMMMTYLFITLITVVKITNIFFGPLRFNF